jgi:hypothetical protein
MRPGTSRFTPVAKTLGYCAPIAIFALLMNAAAPEQVRAEGGGGLVQWGSIQGWGSGPINAEVQPGTTTPCDASHQCEITVGGKATLGQVARFDLWADFTVDFPDGTTNGFGGHCYPVTGTLWLTSANARSDTLAIDIQGVDCAVGASTTVSALDASYVVDNVADGTGSTGKFAGATGTGTVRAATDSSQSPQTVEFAFNGSLLGADQFGKHAKH